MAPMNSNPFRRSLLACAVAAGLALSAGGAAAQSTNDDHSSKPNTEAKRASNDARKTWEQTHRASKIIGTEVRNPQDKKIGQVKDLVISDPSSGTISHVVVAVGGVMGMGDKLFAVPFRDISPAPGKDYLVLSASSDLSQGFDEKNWPNQAAWQDRTATSRASLPPSTGTSTSTPPQSQPQSSATMATTPPPSTTPSTAATTPQPSTTPSTAETTPPSTTPSTADTTPPQTTQ